MTNRFFVTTAVSLVITIGTAYAASEKTAGMFLELAAKAILRPSSSGRRSIIAVVTARSRSVRSTI